jgi:predicted nuclease of predicted toxin-antitoxin system
MKVLLDSCVSAVLRPPLEAAGHDVVWVGDWSRDPGDQEILAFAYGEQRIVITLDKDFGTLNRYHSPHRHA